jgi:serine protease inhibitor
VHALFAAALVCSAVSGAQPVAVSTLDLARADNKFGLELFSNIAASRPQQNVFISPLSIALALQMTALGAAGATADVMADAMNLSGHSMSEVAVSNLELREQLANPGKDVRLDVANSLWLRAGVNLQKQYTEDCSRYYNAPVTILDFGGTGAATAINNWVAKNTAGRIKQIVSELKPKEFLVLVNAIYFKGSWTKPFDTKLTSPREFHLIKGSVLRRMMNREGKFRYRADSTMQAVALPYGTQRLSMYVFLPRDNDGLVKFIDGLNPDNVAGLFVGLGERKGTVVLPRFKIEFEQVQD